MCVVNVYNKDKHSSVYPYIVDVGNSANIPCVPVVIVALEAVPSIALNVIILVPVGTNIPTTKPITR